MPHHANSGSFKPGFDPRRHVFSLRRTSEGLPRRYPGKEDAEPLAGLAPQEDSSVLPGTPRAEERRRMNIYHAVPAMRCHCPAKHFRSERAALEYAQKAADTFRVAYAVWRVRKGTLRLLKALLARPCPGAGLTATQNREETVRLIHQQPCRRVAQRRPLRKETTMPATINVEDIDPEQRKQLGIRKPRETAFSKDELRGWALKVLALMANLSLRRTRARPTPCPESEQDLKSRLRRAVRPARLISLDPSFAFVAFVERTWGGGRSVKRENLLVHEA